MPCSARAAAATTISRAHRSNDPERSRPQHARGDELVDEAHLHPGLARERVDRPARPGDLPDAVTRREARPRGRLVLLAGVESGQAVADDLQRHVAVPLLAQHEPQTLDVGRRVLPVAGRGPHRLDEPLLLEEPELGRGDGRELDLQRRQHVGDAHRGATRDAPGPRLVLAVGRDASCGAAWTRCARALVTRQLPCGPSVRDRPVTRRPRRGAGWGGTSCGTCRSAPRRRTAARTGRCVTG